MIQEQMLSKILNTKDSSIITLNNLGVEYFSDYVTEFNFIKNHLNQHQYINTHFRVLLLYEQYIGYD